MTLINGQMEREPEGDVAIAQQPLYCLWLTKGEGSGAGGDREHRFWFRCSLSCHFLTVFLTPVIMCAISRMRLQPYGVFRANINEWMGTCDTAVSGRDYNTKPRHPLPSDRVLLRQRPSFLSAAAPHQGPGMWAQHWEGQRRCLGGRRRCLGS